MAALATALVAGCDPFAEDGPDASLPEPSLADVQGLFAERCAGSSCHVGFDTEPAGQMDLRAEAACSNLIDIMAQEVPSLLRVVRNEPDASYLVCKLTPGCEDLPERAQVMPPTLEGGLPASERDLVVRWIAAGAPGCPTPRDDVTAPIFAGAKSATPLAQAVRLDWDAAADDVTAAGDLVYLVYQATAAGGQDFTTPVLETEPGVTTATASGLEVATEYFFVVRARDIAGNIDTNTAEISATTLSVTDTTPPTFDGVASGSAIGTSAVQLVWLAASDDVAPPGDIVYNVYMSEASGGQDFTTPVLTTAAGATDGLVRGLRAGVEYFFVVRAEDRAGNEDANTAEIAVTTESAIIFSEQVEPIFIESCAKAGCHDSAASKEGLDLSEGAAHASLVDMPASQCINVDDRLRVAPQDPEGSYLVDKLAAQDLCDGTPMPKGGALSESEIELINQWIAAGAPNN